MHDFILNRAALKITQVEDIFYLDPFADFFADTVLIRFDYLNNARTDNPVAHNCNLYHNNLCSLTLIIFTASFRLFRPRCYFESETHFK